MTAFDDRESAFEAKYAHDEEMNFKVQSRANKKLALWAAKKLGKPADQLDAYVREVIAADFKEAGHEDVIEKVAQDLGARADLDEVRAARAGFVAEAKAEVMQEL